MDNVYMFAFRYMKWLFAIITLAILTEGLIFFFTPQKAIQWLEKIPKGTYRLIGLAEIAFALGLIYLILYR